MISLNLAKQITAIAIQQAKQQEFNICVSVVDQAGLLVHFERMDNALLGAIDVAIKRPEQQRFSKPIVLNLVRSHNLEVRFIHLKPRMEDLFPLVVV